MTKGRTENSIFKFLCQSSLFGVPYGIDIIGYPYLVVQYLPAVPNFEFEYFPKINDDKTIKH